MNSLKQIQQTSVRRKQVYKPILDNPYTDESHMWPFVRDQPLVADLVKTHVITPLAHARSLQLDAPFQAYSGFNNVVQYLQAPPSTASVFLFVCNRDDVPSVLLSQIPLLASISSIDVTLVPLPRGSNAVVATCTEPDHDGLLLVVEDSQFDSHFAAQVRQRVDHVIEKPWLQFTKSRIGVLSSTVALSSKANSKSK